MTKSDNLDKLPADVKRSVLMATLGVAALPTQKEREAGEWAITVITAGIRRTTKRQTSDKVSDRRRRILIGARLPRSVAARYASCARLSGRSLYSLVKEAVLKECELIEKLSHRTWDGHEHRVNNPYPPDAPCGAASSIR